MSGDLLMVRVDGTTAFVGAGYESVKAALDGGVLDFTVGGKVGGFIDDEGLLKGLPLNVPVSMMMGRPLFGTVVVAAPDPDSDGETVPLPYAIAKAVEAAAAMWQRVIEQMLMIGQDPFLMARPDRLPPPMIVELPDDWQFGDPIPWEAGDQPERNNQ